jgi:hypothetical protein
MLILFIILVLAAGAYYFLVFKKKKAVDVLTDHLIVKTILPPLAVIMPSEADVMAAKETKNMDMRDPLSIQKSIVAARVSADPFIAKVDAYVKSLLEPICVTRISLINRDVTLSAADKATKIVAMRALYTKAEVDHVLGVMKTRDHNEGAEKRVIK